MTKKFICPKCKEKLKMMLTHHALVWKIDANGDVSNYDSETGDAYKTRYYECPECYLRTKKLEEFIVEEET